MCLLTILLEYEACLCERTRGRAVRMLGQGGENAPHCTRFECNDNLGTTLAAYTVDGGKILHQQLLVKHIAG